MLPKLSEMQCKMRQAGPEEWAELLETCGSDYALSQTYEFGQALERAYDEYSYEPRIIEFSDGSIMLLPLVKVRRRLNFLRCFEAMPFSLPGAPLCVSGALTSMHFMVALRSLQADSVYLNTGGLYRLPPDGRGLDDGIGVTEHSTFILDLRSGFENVWDNYFTRKTRNQCRLAQRKGVRVERAGAAEDFETYYSIYAASTRRWGYDTPPYPIALFNALASLAGNGVELKLARAEGRVIAGVLLLHGRKTTLYWGAAMLKEYASYSPNNALLHAAIEEACGQGKSHFDFGSSDGLESVNKYKESFGAQPVSYRNFVFTAPRFRLVTRARKALAQAGI